MTTTKQQSPAADTKSSKPWWKQPLVIGGAGVLVIVVIAVAIALAAGGGDEDEAAAPTTTSAPVTTTSAPTTTPTTVAPQPAEPAVLTPVGVMERMTEAVIAANPEEFADIVAEEPVDDASGLSFLEWNLAMGMDPVFSNCQERTTGVIVVCEATSGEEYFHSILAGEDLSSTVTVAIGASRVFRVLSWPPADGMIAAETDFRAWIVDNYPESEEAMFGAAAGIFRFSEESGHLHMQHLDEYQAYLGA